MPKHTLLEIQCILSLLPQPGVVLSSLQAAPDSETAVIGLIKAAPFQIGADVMHFLIANLTGSVVLRDLLAKTAHFGELLFRILFKYQLSVSHFPVEVCHQAEMVPVFLIGQSLNHQP